MAEGNGTLPQSIFDRLQDHSSKLDTIEDVNRTGFDLVAKEIRSLRTGMLDVIVDSDKKAFEMVKQMMTLVSPIFKTLCWAFIIMLMWLTGLKYLAPHIFSP